MRWWQTGSVFLLSCSPPLPPAPAPPAAVERVAVQAAVDCSSPTAFAGPMGGERTPAASAELARRYLERCGLEHVVELTRKLVAFPTVSEQIPPDGAPFRQMRAFLAGYAKQHGLVFRAFGDDVWQLELGEGERPGVAFVMHGDVVPVGARSLEVAASGSVPAGWGSTPFVTRLAGGKLYGRGAEDDKGPIAAALVTLATLAELGWRPRHKVAVIIGTGEEHDWSGMKRYAKEQPAPRFTISIDAEFPVVVAESGFVRWELAFAPKPKQAAPPGCRAVTGASAGEFLTQVPGRATLTLAAALDVPGLLNGAAPPGTRVQVSGAEVTAFGQAVHSSVAYQGHNALWALATAAGKLDLCPGAAAAALGFVRELLAGDHWGQRLGLAFSHELMGGLLVIPTMLRLDGEQAHLSINMRAPAGKSAAELGRELDRTLVRLARRFPGMSERRDQRYVGEPALADTAGPLVPTLMDIYQSLSGDRMARPKAIRGGTYARLFPGAVSFGPALPGEPYRGHAPDEYVTVAALRLMSRATLAAILRLDPLVSASTPRATGSR